MGVLRLPPLGNSCQAPGMEQERTKEEVDRRAAENLRRMIATPPQPKAKPGAAAPPARASSADSGAKQPVIPIHSSH
jgi:hypothetical protein